MITTIKISHVKYCGYAGIITSSKCCHEGPKQDYQFSEGLSPPYWELDTLKALKVFIDLVRRDINRDGGSTDPSIAEDK